MTCLSTTIGKITSVMLDSVRLIYIQIEWVFPLFLLFFIL